MPANTVTISNALSAYTEVHRDELITKSSLGAKTLEYIDIMPNVKSKELIPYLDSTVVLQNASCGWNPQGTDSFTERYIEVKPLEVEKEYCYLDFQKSWANNQLLIEAGRESLPWEEKITESNLNGINEALEDLLWKGNTGISISGFTTLISGETSAVKIDFATGSTRTQQVNTLVAAIPTAALKKGVNLFMSYTAYREYIAEQNGTCCANRPIIDAAQESIKYVGDSRIQIVPVVGLETASSADTQYMVFATPDALVYATDVEGSENVFDWDFDKKNQKFDFRVLFNAGTAIRFPDEVGVGALSA